MAIRTNTTQRLILAFVAIMAALAFAQPATAQQQVPIPGTMTGESSSFAVGIAAKQVKVKGSWIGIAEKIKTTKKKSPEVCRWFNKFYNSNYVLGYKGKIRYYLDNHGYLCKEPRSPSGWVKRGGGHTGLDCRNIAYPKKPPHKKIYKRPAAEFMSATSALVKVYVTATAQASVHLWCGDASALGSASDIVTVRYSAYFKVKSTAAKVKLYLSIAIKASDVAVANAKVKCSYTPPPGGGTPPPPPPPLPPSVAITGRTILNDVPEGKSSGPMPFKVNASAAGSVTVNPDLGSVSSCTSTTRQASVTFSFAAGDNSLCVIYYAPGESSVMQDRITYTAIVTTAGGTAKDVKSDVFAITHPIRS